MNANDRLKQALQVSGWDGLHQFRTIDGGEDAVARLEVAAEGNEVEYQLLETQGRESIVLMAFVLRASDGALLKGTEEDVEFVLEVAGLMEPMPV